MPFIGQRDTTKISSLNDARLFVEYVTTTLYTNPTTTPVAAQVPGPSVPVAAIAGGVVAGALLAIAATAGWVYWGKSIKRTQAKQRREAEAFRKTRHNTLHNATLTKPQVQSYRPLLARPLEKKIKFVGHDSPKVNGSHSDTPRVPSVPFVNEKRPVTTRAAVPSLKEGSPAAKPSKPRPLRSMKASRNLTAEAESMRQSPPTPTKIPRKPSTISSASSYSMASGEEHQTRAPSNLILSALGNLGGSVDAALNRNSYSTGDQRSVASSNRSLFSRLGLGVLGNATPNRFSQASSGSAYSQQVDEFGMSIGVAL